MILKFILRKIFPSTLYVKVSKNQFHVNNIETKRQVQVFSEEPFTTQRLLIGEFIIA